MELETINLHSNREVEVKPKAVPLLISDFETGKEISVGLIKDHHPHLATAKILYLCRNRAVKQGGIKVPGNVKRASPIEKHLSCSYFGDEEEADFILTIALDVWNDLNQNQRLAVVDHLLTRCVGEEDEGSGEMKFSLRPPSVQEFPEIAKRYGTWNQSLLELSENFRRP